MSHQESGLTRLKQQRQSEIELSNFAGVDKRHAIELEKTSDSGCIVGETGLFRTLWDYMLVVLLAYSMTIMPVRLAFDKEEHSVTLDIIVDALFLVDIIIMFFTAFKVKMGDIFILETRHSHIARHYIKTWFFVDFLSTFPFYLVDDQSAVVFKLLKAFRMIRIVRLFYGRRVLSDNWFRKMIGYITFGYRPSPTTSRILKAVLSSILICHISACAWFSLVDASDPDSWTRGSKYDNASALQLYWGSFYWAAQTLTTVGYGDTLPSNNSEYAMTMFAMLGGCTFFAYVTGTISSLVIGLDRKSAEYRNNYMGLSDFLSEYKVNGEVGADVRSHLHALWSRTIRPGLSYSDVMRQLPEQLQNRLRSEVFHTVIQRSDWLLSMTQNKEYNRFLNRFSMCLTRLKFLPNYLIVRRGAAITDFYILNQGTALALKNGVMTGNELEKADAKAAAFPKGKPTSPTSPMSALTIPEEDSNGDESDAGSRSGSRRGSKRRSLGSLGKSPSGLLKVAKFFSKADNKNNFVTLELQEEPICPQNSFMLFIEYKEDGDKTHFYQQGDYMELLNANKKKTLFKRFITLEEAQAGIMLWDYNFDTKQKYFFRYNSHNASKIVCLGVSSKFLPVQAEEAQVAKMQLAGGDVFGEVPLFMTTYWPFDVRCESECDLYSITIENMLQLLERAERRPESKSLLRALHAKALGKLEAMDRAGVIQPQDWMAAGKNATPGAPVSAQSLRAKINFFAFQQAPSEQMGDLGGPVGPVRRRGGSLLRRGSVMPRSSVMFPSTADAGQGGGSGGANSTAVVELSQAVASLSVQVQALTRMMAQQSRKESTKSRE